MARKKKNDENDRIRKILESNDSKIHFVGIGGVSMYSLARLSLYFHKKISGSDRENSHRTDTLKTLGIDVKIGHSEKNITDQDLVVYTHAVAEDNPEIISAKEKSIPCVSRAEYLGALMTEYDTRIGISGTHGKSTTVAMIDMILSFASKEHTTLSGAPLVPGEPYKVGREKDILLYEACEYKDSFLKFHPSLAVALNLEYDHPDYFRNISALRESFTKALSKAKTVIINNDDENLSLVASKIKNTSEIIKVGVRNTCDYSYRITSYQPSGYKFEISDGKEVIGEFELNIPGAYNVTNATMATVVALRLGIDVEIIKRALFSYSGISGRMEKLGIFENKEVFSDYAHHPTAIRSSINALKMYTKDSITVVFKPHTYSRTKALFEDFAKALSLADHVILTEIYPAREEDNLGISSESLVSLIGNGAVYCTDFEVKETLSAINHGVIVLMGAAGLDIIKKELI